MTDIIPGASLIRGGINRKIRPYKVPPRMHEEDKENSDEVRPQSARDASRASSQPPVEPRAHSSIGSARGSGPQLPPLPHLQGTGNMDKEGIVPDRLPLTERRLLRRRNHKLDTILPQMAGAPPVVPPAPYALNHLPHENEEAGRFEYPPPFIGMDTIKHPLVSFPGPTEERRSASANGSLSARG